MITINPRLGVSSWSLNNSLTRGDFSLLELPGLAAQHGLGKVEICHFHLKSTDPGYLAELKAAHADAGVIFYTFLQDAGDITHPDPEIREQQIVGIERAIDVAWACGAERIRVIAGSAEPSSEAMSISVKALRRLAKYAVKRGVRVVTENWHRLLDHPAQVIELMEWTEGQVGLKLDFGNWPRDRKYTDLPQIARFAECTHAKADFNPIPEGRTVAADAPSTGVIDEIDFVRCLDICKAAKFGGPHILIFASPGDEWGSLDIMRDIAAKYV